MSPALKGSGKRLLLLLGSTVLSLVVLELGARVLDVFWPPHFWHGDDVYDSNPRGYFTPGDGGLFRVENERADYHACDAPLDASKGQVLFIGDSFCHGLGVRGQDVFSTQLDFPGHQRRNCCEIGADINSPDGPWIIGQFRRQRELYRPALTIYTLVLNDLGTGNDIENFINFRTMNLDEYLEYRYGESALLGVLSRFAAFRRPYRDYVHHEVARETIAGYYRTFAEDEHRERCFDEIAAMAAQSDRFLVMVFPLLVDLEDYPFEGIHLTIAEELAQRGLPALDLLDVFRGHDADDLIVHPVDRHPNEIAHRMAAEALRVHLRERGWLPPDVLEP